ncbi:MAG: hypothetical protein B6I20_03980 [Bacteroidetes bacterium 4572_117]|nr:MAG: hypothetical protein B6I20_03980 [Bacteroidetes bacterium 4572_117]
MNRNYFFALVLSLLIIVHKLHAQVTIKTLPVYKKTIDYNFSSEWQYLSTDLYLFNTDKFNRLVNKVAVSGKSKSGRKRKKKQEETIQSLFIKAKIKDIKFFGGDLLYPIYNFKITKDENYSTQISSTIEVIRLIDNLPLLSSKDFVEAEISGQIITKKNSDDFMRLIAKQLQNISQYSKPNVAILDLIGEIGKFIESKTTGTQYKFSSTIRLYEDQNFNKKLHSLNIFAFVPSTVSKVNVLASGLTDYLDNTKNPVVNQKKLKQLINFRTHPLIVIANYKSKYNTQPVIGDQINFDYIAERKLKVGNAYRNELINKETYVQESALIAYLELFVSLKLNINNYKLNKQNKITDDFSKNIFVIMQDYRRLVDLKTQREIEYSKNPVFQSEFKEKYKTVMSSANIYLETEQDLKNIRDIMAVVRRQEKQLNTKPDSAQMEADLKILYSVTFPESELGSAEAQIVNNCIQKTEYLLYTSEFLELIGLVNDMGTEPENISQRNVYGNHASLTNCKLCSEKLNESLKTYTKKYKKHQKSIAGKKNELQKQKAIGLLFKMIRKKNNIEKNISILKSDSIPEYFSLFEMEFNKFRNYISCLNDIVRTDIKDFSIEAILEQNEEIETLIKNTDLSYVNLYSNLPDLCKEN